MIDDVIHILRCPLCAAELTLADRTARCGSGHAFDVASRGYLNLLPGDADTGTADTAEMVDARARFLATGAFGPIADSLAHRAADVTAAGAVIDAGAGTGYHLARVLDRDAERLGVALDLSKHAARRAAKAHARIGAVVADTWRGLPVRDGAAAVVLDVFAPRNATEFARVLAPGGVLITVTPRPEHLDGLVGPLGLIDVDPDKETRLAASFGTAFTRLDTAAVVYETALTRETAELVALMGPSAWHTDESFPGRLAELPEPIAATVAVDVTAWLAR
jgi:23S rRNA (guanine745-N1)-methyltransferase